VSGAGGRAGLPWRPLGWGLAAILTLLAGIGLSRLRIDDDLRALIRDGSDSFAVVDQVAAVFGPPDRDCIVRVTARDGDIFSPGTLEAVEQLADRLAAVPGVEQVRSIFDARHGGQRPGSGPSSIRWSTASCSRPTPRPRCCSCGWRPTATPARPSATLLPRSRR